MDFLLGRIARRAVAVAEDSDADGDVEAVGPPLASRDALEVAREINRGLLHVTGVVIEVHHLATFNRILRSHNNAGSGPTRRPVSATADTTAQYARSFIRQFVDAGLHVVLTTPIADKLPSRQPSVVGRDADLLNATDDTVDLSLVVSPATSARSDNAFTVSVQRSTYSALPDGITIEGARWADLLARIRPVRPWSERLAEAYPRIEEEDLSVRRESVGVWTDPTQDEFARWAEQRGWTVTCSSPDEDRRAHWDLRIERGKEHYRIDVKARSRLRRRDPESQDTWHWVELRGIIDDGWLFGGEADLVAFQTSVSFILVPRRELATYVAHHVDPDRPGTDPRRAEYRIYHRRDDPSRPHSRATGTDRGVLTLVPTNRLRLLAWEEWSAQAVPNGSPSAG
jgi:hypothetical protein